MVLIALLLALTAAAGDEYVSEEVTVYGDHLVEQARQAVVQNLERQGYLVHKVKDDYVIMRHELPWRGDVLLYDDGWMRVKRQPTRFEGREMPWAKKNTALAWAGCVLWVPLCVRPGGQLISRTKFSTHETRVVQRSHRDINEYAERVSDLAVSNKLDELPDHLDLLWLQGVPLDPGDETTLTTITERKAAVLAFWESRTETPWGEVVRGGVETYIRAVIQHSDTPFSESELTAFNAQTRAARPLVIDHVADDG